MCDKFNQLDKIIRIILFIPFWGWIVSGIYRILKFIDGGNNGNILTLILGILSIVIPFIGLVFSIVDLVTTITNDKVTFFAE